MSIWNKMWLVLTIALAAAGAIVFATSPASSQIVPATHAGNFWDEGEEAYVKTVCNTRATIERIGWEYETSTAGGNAAFMLAKGAGTCTTFFAYPDVVLVERFGRFQTAEGPVVEVWSLYIEASTVLVYALYALPAGASTTPGRPTPVNGGRDA